MENLFSMNLYSWHLEKSACVQDDHLYKPIWHQTHTEQIFSSYQLQRAEEKMNQLRRTWILYVLLQFSLQGAP